MVIPELLAPAGTVETTEAALDHGADAIYAGIGTANLRAFAPSFTPESFGALVRRVHDRKKRVYAVLNTMPDDTGLDRISALLDGVVRCAALPDAWIVSDPGVIRVVRTVLPDAPLHLSTQTGTFNTESCRFWAAQGVSRIVLPREMTLEEIRGVVDAQVAETEVFIHGAMCVSYSGRCLLGAYSAGRHPNRGACPQPCRYRYTISSVQGEHALSLDVEETPAGTALLNARDLNTLSILDRIVATGVSSLKIEGRNKSVHYISTTVKVYRSALDALAASGSGGWHVEPWWERELEQLDHRPYTTGFYAGEYALQATDTARSSSRIRVVGIVKATLEAGEAVVDVKNPFQAGETLSLLPVSQKPPAPVVVTACTDLNGHQLERATTNRLAVVHASVPLRPGDLLRRETENGTNA